MVTRSHVAVPRSGTEAEFMITVPREGWIALVDGDPVDRMIISRVLGLSGLQNPVKEFESANEFLEHNEAAEAEDQIALVLMDINMPGMTGLEALAHLRSKPVPVEHPVVVMLSSSEAKSDMDEAERLGASGYVVKQAGIAAFVSAIDSTLTHDD